MPLGIKMKLLKKESVFISDNDILDTRFVNQFIGLENMLWMYGTFKNPFNTRDKMYAIGDKNETS